MKLWQIVLLMSIASALGSPYGKTKESKELHKSESKHRNKVMFTSSNGERVVVYLKGAKKTKPKLSLTMEKNVIFGLMANGTTDYVTLTLNDVTALESSKWNSTKKTVFVIHGWMNNINSTVIQEVSSSLLTYHDVNVIGVGWGAIAEDLIYTLAAGATDEVGTYVGKFASFLVDQGASPDAIHFVGHSLGAHVAGFAGKYMNSVNRTVGRVTALDAALPGFDLPATERLASTDATFVDCIHTDGGFFGFDKPICQADYYPNGGVPDQPGCSILDLTGSCSHSRSYEFFVESANPKHLFTSKSCLLMGTKSPKECTASSALMGYPATSEHKGLFYLTTGKKSPYASLVLS